MDVLQIDLVDISRLGPTAGRLLDALAQHDHVAFQFEMSMDQMQSKFRLDIVSEENTGKVLQVLFSNVRLNRIIQKMVVPVRSHQLKSYTMDNEILHFG